MTDAEFLAWLEDDNAERVVLLEVGVKSGGVETTRYISSREYISRSTDTPASTAYEPILIGGLTVEESMGIDGESVSFSQGDVKLLNSDGEFDSWLNDVWSNRPITAYFGDISWARVDFRKVYAGIVASCDPDGRNFLLLRMQDLLQRLESSMTENRLNTSLNSDAIIPLAFGECHNVEPLLTNAGTLEYEVHDGPIEDIIEVRDNGVPVAITKYLATGKFTLTKSPIGAITASVQGAKPAAYGYYNDPVDLASIIVREYGRSDLRFVVGEMDVSNFSAMATANMKPVGIYIRDKTTVREVCDALLSSVGARLTLSRTGLLRCVKVEVPPASTVATITEDDYIVDSIQPAQRSAIRAAAKIAYCKNWTVQANIPSGVLPEHAKLFAQEWLTESNWDSTVANDYKLSKDVDQEETLLLVKNDAINEAIRRLAIRKVQRNVYKMTCFAPALMLELGNGVTLYSSRYGLSGGVVGQVVSLSLDWIHGQVEVGILV